MNAPVKGFEGINRREVLVVGAAVVGSSLVVGCSLPDALSSGAPKTDFGAFGPFLKIAQDGTVTVINKHLEMGQGTHAGLAAIVAEELDADWTKVRVEAAPAITNVYANTLMKVQGTGGSSGVANSWMQLRKVGAAARSMFVEAAANRWKVAATDVTVKDGVVSHAASGKSATFAELLPDAAKVAPPENPTLKDPKAFTLVGTDRVRRKDAQAKSDGTAIYTQDVRKDGMVYAMVAHSSRFGGKVKSFDGAAAKKVAGVVDVFQIPSGVAVVASSTYAARLGRDALKVEWDDGKAEMRSTDAIMASYRDAVAGQGGAKGGEAKWEVFETRGDVAAPAPAGGKTFKAQYEFPYLAHAPMEPMNCVAEVDGNKATITTASQIPTMDQLNTAQIVLTLPGAVKINTLPAGGSFGRRANLQSDYVVECVHIAKKLGHGKPVKLVWTREDDFMGGHFRPMVLHDVEIVTDKDGYPVRWKHRVVTQSIMEGSPMKPKGVDETMVEGAKGSPYLKATPVVDAQVFAAKSPVSVLWWRSVGATHTAFTMEHTIDQLAKAAGKDPVEYRRELYKRAGANRHLAVLNLAVEKAGWGKPTAGYTQGVAVHESFGSVVAQVAEVKLENGEPRVGRVVTAIDCGVAVSPDQVAAQMEGGTCFGLSAALFGKVELKDGLLQQTNFDSYRVLRMNEAPQVETYIIPSANPPSGVGEPGTPVIGPAVANALLAMNGTASYSQPLVKS